MRCGAAVVPAGATGGEKSADGAHTGVPVVDCWAFGCFALSVGGGGASVSKQKEKVLRCVSTANLLR